MRAQKHLVRCCEAQLCCCSRCHDRWRYGEVLAFSSRCCGVWHGALVVAARHKAQSLLHTERIRPGCGAWEGSITGGTKMHWNLCHTCSMMLGHSGPLVTCLQG